MKDYQVNLNKTQEEDVVIFCFVEFEYSNIPNGYI